MAVGAHAGDGRRGGAMRELDMDARGIPTPWALAGGVVLLVLGVALLLRNAGVIQVDWGFLWPAIVIALGVVLIVGGLRRDADGPGAASVTIPSEDAARLQLSLRVGAGTYRLAGGGPALVSVDASGPTIDQRVERHGDVARVRLATAVDQWHWGRTAQGTDWRIAVTPRIPVEIDAQAGAGSFDLDLEGVAVAGATVAAGAADVRVVLPRPRGEVPIRVEGGAAQLTFEIPAGVEARVATRGLVATSGPSQTAGWATAPDRVTVDVTGGIASVRVVQRG
jgi:hypothetical protein